MLVVECCTEMVEEQLQQLVPCTQRSAAEVEAARWLPVEPGAVRTTLSDPAPAEHTRRQQQLWPGQLEECIQVPAVAGRKTESPAVSVAGRRPPSVDRPAAPDVVPAVHKQPLLAVQLL